MKKIITFLLAVMMAVTCIPQPVLAFKTEAVSMDSEGTETSTTTRMTASGHPIGDVNGDGLVDKKDLTTLSRYLTKWAGIELVDAEAADIDGENGVSVADRMILARYLAGKEEYEEYFLNVEYYTVTFDPNGDGVENMPEPQRVKAGECAVKAGNVPERKGYVFLGWYMDENAVPFIDSSFDFDEEKMHNNITLYASWLEEEADIDGDGLSFVEEKKAGTDAYRYDTDSDGLSDGEEVNELYTDPTNDDTDGDGITDGVEVAYLLDPFSMRTDGTNLDCDSIVQTDVYDYSGDFTLSVRGKVSDVIEISVEEYTINMEEIELISSLVEINGAEFEDLENATLTFDYSDVEIDNGHEQSITFVVIDRDGTITVLDSIVNTGAKTVTVDLMSLHCGMRENAPTTTNVKMNLLVNANTEVPYYSVAYKNKVPETTVLNNKSKINYDGQDIIVNKIADSGFDVGKHGYSFKNFAVTGYNSILNEERYLIKSGCCYGFMLSSYYSYMGNLPIKKIGQNETYTGTSIPEVPSYDLSDIYPYYTGQLWNLRNEIQNTTGNRVTVDGKDYSKSQVISCIVNYQQSVGSIDGKLFYDIEYNRHFKELCNRLMGGEPVPLGLVHSEPFETNTGHAVLAISLYKGTYDGIYYMQVYDCNYPGELRYIIGKKGKNTIQWQYGKYNYANLFPISETDEPYVPHTFSVECYVDRLLDGAAIQIADTNNGYFRDVISNGKVIFENIPNNIYTLTLNADGYEPYTYPQKIQGWGDTERVYISIDDLTPTNYDQKPYLYEGHRYMIFSYTDMNWSEAKEYCEKLGGHLATIASSDENEFVKGLCTVSECYYLGGTNDGVAGEWRWITDEKWDYTNWYPDEPNNLGDEQHYLAMWGANAPSDNGEWGFWDDTYLYTGYTTGFVCEWDY